MSLADFPSLLLLPPLNCMVAACAGGVLWRRRAGRVLLAIGLAGLALLSVPLVAGRLLASLEGGLPSRVDPHDPPGAVVILSGDGVELVAGGLAGWDIGRLTLERERAGARTARATGLPVLVSGGVVKPGAPSLASLMARSLREDFATAPRWLEADSQDTWQNASFSAAVLRPAGIGTVYLVTHAWHMRRALIAFRAAGLHAVAAPVDPVHVPRLTFGNLIPRVSAWQDSLWALHEWIGCAWYAVHG